MQDNKFGMTFVLMIGESELTLLICKQDIFKIIQFHLTFMLNGQKIN